VGWFEEKAGHQKADKGARTPALDLFPPRGGNAVNEKERKKVRRKGVSKKEPINFWYLPALVRSWADFWRNRWAGKGSVGVFGGNPKEGKLSGGGVREKNSVVNRTKKNTNC